MTFWVVRKLCKYRLGVLGCALALAVAACGQVGLSTSPTGPTSAGATGATPPPGSQPPGTSSPGNSAPVISGTPATTAVVGESYSFTPTASDPQGAGLTFSIANLPNWASFDNTSGRLSGAPSADSVGTYANIQISVSNGQASATLDPFAITLAAQLILSGTPATSAVVGSPYSFQPTTNAGPNATLTFTVQNLPAWAQFDSTTGEISGTPTQTGTFADIVITVNDGVQTSALAAFSITVSAPTQDSPPSISGHPATSVVAGNLYSFTPTASDPNHQTLTFSVQNLPAWASFNPANGSLTGTPTQAGTYGNIVISASDGTLSASLPAFSIKVAAPLNISGTPATQVVAGHSYSFKPTTNAPSGTSLTFAIQSRPTWASFSASTGILSGTPTAAQSGTYSNIVISVSDGVQSVALAAFSIRVEAPLTLSGNPPTQVQAGQAYSFQPTTNAAAGTPLTFAIANKPSWALFNAANGVLSGTPASNQTGTYANIAISVSDGLQTSALAAFTITVTATPQPPTISGTPATTVGVGSPYGFTPTAADPAGKPLSFSIQNKPSWATFSAASGALTGTPAASNAGSYTGIVITVSDGTLSASLPTFSSTVTAAAKPPTISGTPPTSVNVGAGYSFTPSATDPAGKPLTFSIQNLPGWASFNSSNGALTGTPTSASAGTYTNIVITVSDGTLSASLPAFTITVNQVSNGSANLTWTPVTQNTDGSVLTNLAGYKVYWGTSPGNMNQSVTLANPSLTTYLVTNLSSGTWYFGVAAYTSTGMQGTPSNVGSKQIP